MFSKFWGGIQKCKTWIVRVKVFGCFVGCTNRTVVKRKKKRKKRTRWNPDVSPTCVSGGVEPIAELAGDGDELELPQEATKFIKKKQPSKKVKKGRKLSPSRFSLLCDFLWQNQWVSGSSHRLKIKKKCSCFHGDGMLTGSLEGYLCGLLKSHLCFIQH